MAYDGPVDQKQYKMLCIVCGQTCGGHEDPQDSIRIITFGHSDDDCVVYAMLGVCKEHVDVPTTDLRRHFYREVSQAREWDHWGGMQLIPREDDEK